MHESVIKQHSPKTITGMLAESVSRSPDALAAVYGDTSITYRELDEMSRRMATGLQELGIKEGDRIAIWLPNTIAYIVIYLACARLAAIAVAVNTRYRSIEVGDIIHRVEATLLVVWPNFRDIDFLGILNDIEPASLAGLQSIILYNEDELPMELPDALKQCHKAEYKTLISQPAMIADNAQPDSGCNIFTTSGTTKAPKFVLHTQRDIVEHALDITVRLGKVLSEGAQLQALPLCGVFGFTQFSASLAAGRPIVLMSAFSAEEAIGLIDSHNVRYLNATDDMIESLLAADTRDQVMPTLAYCGFGSFNSDPARVVNNAESRGLTLVGLYGMSEVQALFAMQNPDAPIEKRMLGGGELISMQANVRVRDLSTGKIQPHGQQGEIEICGPGLMKGYFNNPQATSEAITKDGFLRPGDIGYTIDERRFVFLARMGDVLRLGGFLVSPVEIEAFIQEYETVEGCQVVAINYEGRMRPFAFVTLLEDGTFNEQQIINHCKDGLAGYKTPVRVFELSEFPVTHGANGTKIQRARLRQWAQDWMSDQNPTT